MFSVDRLQDYDRMCNQILVMGNIEILLANTAGRVRLESTLKALIKSLENEPLAQTDHPYYIVNK